MIILSPLTLKSFFLVGAGVFNLILGSLVLIKSHKEPEHKSFFAISIGVFIWAISHAIFEFISIDSLYISTATSLPYIGAALIPVSFLFFSTYWGTHTLKIDKLLLFSLVFYFVMVVSVLIPGVVIKSVILENGIKIIQFGWGYGTYVAYIIGVFFLAFYRLLREYNIKTGILKIQTRYILFGTATASLIGLITNLLLPMYGNFSLFWLGPIATIIMVLFIGYAIARYKLWDFRLIVAEVSVTFILFILFINIFLARSFLDFSIKTSIFILLGMFGFLLVRGIRNEVETRERIEILVFDIATANKKLRKMERQKSEFVSIASHQLRTPLTAIKGYASMLIEGSFGEISSKLKDAIEKIYQSSQTLVVIIEDFLIISRIEQGRMHYELDEVDIGSVVKEVVGDVRQDVQRKGLMINISLKKDIEYLVYADYLKTKQVIRNVIDNAVVYTEKGSINVSVSMNKKDRKIYITISDTGIGIDKESMSGLFEKFSDWGEDKITSGVGLFVANEIVKAHRGKIWAESDGLGHGATFFIELPKK